MTLKTLYKKTKTGATQVCIISTLDDTFSVEFGQLGGKMQTKTTTCLPKNIGKSNATTGVAQAKAEALAKHSSKIKSGYTTDINQETEVKLPMKVKIYQDQKNNVIFPCYASFKLNGVNATFKLVDDELILTSRGGNVYPSIPHLEPELLEIMRILDTDTLAGELYIHGKFLQDITSYVKKPKPESENLKFYIFDLPEIHGNYLDRFALKLVPEKQYDFVKLIQSMTLNSHEEIESFMTMALDRKFEGIVINNSRGLYQYNVRSSDVFKYKIALDAEFKVVSFALDKNNHVVFVCETPEGKTFKVKPKGTNEERLRMAAEAEVFIGKWLKIEFEAYSKDLIPQKPVGILFRDCNSDGTPLE